MTWNEACSLDQSLLSLESFFNGKPKLAELLSGGLTNRCWKVDSNTSQSFVWRPISSVTNTYGVSRMREYRMLEALCSSHDKLLAPKPVHLNDSGLLVEWIEGEVAERFPLSETEIIGTLARVHAINIHNKPIPLFSFTAKVDGYWHQLRAREPHLLTKEYQALYQEYRELPNVEPVEATLCHFDLGSYNVIRTDKGIRVIDWEYAGVADPRMDLAMTIDVNGIDMPKAVADYCKLRGIDNADIWFKGVNQWVPRNRMMAILWYLLGYQLWKEEHYLEEAVKLKSHF
ncbi:phosphotransferase [Vibrio sp. HN007]|uniref:phosphotransferase n=1 Tax=Vibrio iocasae TaxID=3098914 RepID=UPI0035D5279D